MIFQLRRSDHITEAIASLHWLRVPECIQFKIAVLTYKVLHGTAPRWLGPLVHVSDLPGRRHLHSARSLRSNCLLLAVEHLMMLLLEHGTVCRRMWHHHQHNPLFVQDLKRICFANLIPTLYLYLIILSSPHSGFEVALLLRPLWKILIDWSFVQFFFKILPNLAVVQWIQK